MLTREHSKKLKKTSLQKDKENPSLFCKKIKKIVLRIALENYKVLKIYLTRIRSEPGLFKKRNFGGLIEKKLCFLLRLT